jgi:hypothetical protein
MFSDTPPGVFQKLRVNRRGAEVQETVQIVIDSRHLAKVKEQQMFPHLSQVGVLNGSAE